MLASILTFIQAHWKWVAIGVAALIFLIWIGSATGVNKKLWNYAWEQINHRENDIIKTLETETEKLAIERDQIAKELAKIKKDRDTKLAQIMELEVKNRELKEKLARVVIPTTPNELVDRLKSRGFHPTIRP